jgi:hypothetical protein
MTDGHAFCVNGTLSGAWQGARERIKASILVFQNALSTPYLIKISFDRNTHNTDFSVF